MKVCILGNGLTSFALAKMLVNMDIYVDIFLESKSLNYSKSRTIGISNSNLNFFNKYIVNIEKILWKLKEIEIFSENLNTKLISFKNRNNEIFSIIENDKLYNLLEKKLKNNKLCKFFILKNNDCSIVKKYDLVINCNINHLLSKKFFHNKLEKKYRGFAYTAIVSHDEIDNKIATQIFTKRGPLAFLPISNLKTSIVYSVNKNEEIDFNNEIKKFNTKYNISKIYDEKKFHLKSSNLRKYYYKNILAFGDMLHTIHPLAGQGFNMTLRNFASLSKIINNNRELGITFNNAMLLDFENQNKHLNFIFSQGIDLIKNFFELESNDKSKILSKSIKLFGNNLALNKTLNKFADNGLLI